MCIYVCMCEHVYLCTCVYVWVHVRCELFEGRKETDSSGDKERRQDGCEQPTMIRTLYFKGNTVSQHSTYICTIYSWLLIQQRPKGTEPWKKFTYEGETRTHPLLPVTVEMLPGIRSTSPPVAQCRFSPYAVMSDRPGGGRRHWVPPRRS